MGQQIPASELVVGDFYVTQAGLRAWSGEIQQVVSTKVTVITHRYIDIVYTCELPDRVIRGSANYRAESIVLRLEETDPARVTRMILGMSTGEHMQVWAIGRKLYT